MWKKAHIEFVCSDHGEWEDGVSAGNVGIRDWKFRWFWRGWRSNGCVEAHQDGCLTLVIVESCEEKLGLMFYLLSPKIDWTALSYAGRGMCSAEDRSCNMWQPRDLMLDTSSRSLLDVTHCLSNRKAFAFQKCFCESLVSPGKERFGSHSVKCRGLFCLATHTVTQLHKDCSYVPMASVGTDDYSILIHTNSWLFILCYVSCNCMTCCICCLYPGCFCRCNPRSV